jgi:Sulfotransferase domain
MMNKPAFIIGGAPRSGTTFLADVLHRHPQVYMAQPLIPEPKVFKGQRQTAAVYLERYARLFEFAPADALCGEKTSGYLESPEACELIQETLPDVRLIFLVREPVARAYSNYLWSRKNGLETLPFEEAIRLEGHRPSPFPPERSYVRPFDYLSRSNYAALAKPFLATFPRAHVRFFLYEDLVLRPEKLFAEVQEFLGLEPARLSWQGVPIVNAARETGPPLDLHLQRRLREQMRAGVLQFAELCELEIEPWEYY